MMRDNFLNNRLARSQMIKGGFGKPLLDIFQFFVVFISPCFWAWTRSMNAKVISLLFQWYDFNRKYPIAGAG